jgi:hypothetical protein
MAKYYQDFVGLNTFMYDVNGWDPDQQYWLTNPEYEAIYSPHSGGDIRAAPVGLNHIGADGLVGGVNFMGSYVYYKNFLFPYNLPNTASFFNSMMIKRNGPYGYPMWKQTRVSHNPLTRKQRKHNVFTFVTEPGDTNTIQINGQAYVNVNRYGSINKYDEPVVTDSHKALELIGGVSVYNFRMNTNEIKNVKIKTTFGNETQFFANNEINNYYETIEETDENYEKLKELYLEGGLEDDSSPLETFNLLTYKQTIWPKIKYSYMDRTRGRTFYINKFWRDLRTDRTQTSISNGFGPTVPSQSMWPLDVASDWATRSEPSIFEASTRISGATYYVGANFGGYVNTGSFTYMRGFNTGEDLQDCQQTALPITGAASSASAGGAGVLMNSYSQLTRGTKSHKSTTYDYFRFIPRDTQVYWNNIMSASAYYTRRHTLATQNSLVSPSGMNLAEVERDGDINFKHLFEGVAAWDAGTQAGKNPFYDSYSDYARNIRLKGKGYSIIPEFRISSHVETYETKGITDELSSIFEISGALSENTTTANSSTFYEILSTSEFLKHFDLIKKDHEDFTKPSILTLKCKAIKKFLPYEGFYPAQRTTQIVQQFSSSHAQYCTHERPYDASHSSRYSVQSLYQPLFAPGVLFNTIKSGVACDFPVIHHHDNLGVAVLNNTGTPSGSAARYNIMISGSRRAADAFAQGFRPHYSQRVPFESLVEPARYLSNNRLGLNEPHTFSAFDNASYSLLPTSTGSFNTVWNGAGDNLYKKMTNNFLAEVPEFFLKNQNFSTLSSLESSNPDFGLAQSGSFYSMRVKMYRSLDGPDDTIPGINGIQVFTPQDLYPSSGVRETLTMYSRPTAFGPPSWAGGYGEYTKANGMVSTTYQFDGSGGLEGYNFPYTPPYYHGEAWCDLLFECKETKKYTLSEILSAVKQHAYFTRFHWPNINNALRDLCGYASQGASSKGPYINSNWAEGSNPWLGIAPASSVALLGVSNNSWNVNTDLTKWPRGLNAGVAGPQHPGVINFNAMQIDSSVNIFGKAIQKSVQLSTDGTSDRIEVFAEGTNEAKSRWVIQPKFETPILNFNKYTNLDENNCTKPLYASASVPRGMWHQYGDIPSATEGVYLEVTDIPTEWFMGALNVDKSDTTKIKSLADLCGFKKKKEKLGQVAESKQISEAVVAIPFIERDATRQFFTIPRVDIDEVLSSFRREVEPGVYVTGGPPKVGETVVDMVKKMRRYVFPPSMDFVRYNDIQPFAMYVFEFTHNLTKQDLADIWQNLPPNIGTSFEESESSISHTLLAHELLGGGSVVTNGKLNENAEGNGIPSNIQWMVFKVKRRAQTNYFDKVIQNTGKFPKPALQLAAEREEEKDRRAEGEDPDITYNWPYDFFSLVELVKIDAEVTLSNIENDDQGNQQVGTIGSSSVSRARAPNNLPSNISKARGRG